MVNFEKRQLNNGLTVIIHQDPTTPISVVNLLYKVGARDEQEHKTGFAHLFEHLMFEGTQAAPDFDEPMEMAGGENNAFTNNDITNYYNTIPVVNLEMALWLEADRMKNLNINDHSLSVQKKVVIEEFKENYINQPYGDTWHKIRSLVYSRHPYRWPTIGMDISHIERINISDVRNFYNSYYTPNNAILVIAGNVEPEKGFDLAAKYFGSIPRGNPLTKEFPQEPSQSEPRFMKIEADVPANMIYSIFHMPDRLHSDYVAYDLLTDILSAGKSSRLFQNLVKKEKLFNNIDSYISGTIDNGLLVIQGMTKDNVSVEEAETAIWKELSDLKNRIVDERELLKFKNRIEAGQEFDEISLLNRAYNLAYFEMLGDANNANHEKEKYMHVMPEDLARIAIQTFQKEKCSTLYYLSKS